MLSKTLREKGIEIVYSSNPTHKPHVESSFRTLLDKILTFKVKRNIKTFNELVKAEDNLSILLQRNFK
ncbi:hypothetical protein BCF59_0256 [Mycoplasmopsis mustelae]|uniref:Uncharacterized protein n=1 Tax=Mycoplasmopsis mustelae TaxID=171289 RepID=A0A4R7UCX4_9BACT|nr:hypothetical protein [Mycoplasmopsis mustelae]TDV24297.1 hypothetical protein BCF59_0256 [Mycoplasmopsis mustelae]